MSENRKTFRLTNDVQQVVDNYREENQTGPSWARKKVNENEAVNLMLDEYPRIKYLEDRLSATSELHERIREKNIQDREIIEAFVQILIPRYREINEGFVQRIVDLNHKVETLENNIKQLTAKIQTPAPDRAAAPAEPDSKPAKAEGTRAKKKTAILEN